MVKGSRGAYPEEEGHRGCVLGALSPSPFLHSPCLLAATAGGTLSHHTHTEESMSTVNLSPSKLFVSGHSDE